MQITDAMLDEALRLRQRGVKWYGIAARLECSQQGLHKRLKQRDGVARGHFSRPQYGYNLRSNGESWIAVAHKCGYKDERVACKTVTNWWNRQGLPPPRTRPAKPAQQRVACACGCGQTRWLLDAYGDERHFMKGHHYRIRHIWRSARAS